MAWMLTISVASTMALAHLLMLVCNLKVFLCLELRMLTEKQLCSKYL